MNNIFDSVQHIVAEQLNEHLSSYCEFIPENNKSIDYEIKQALGKQGIVGLCLTPKATYAGKYEDQSLAWQLDQFEIDIVENVHTNRNKPLSADYMTALDAGAAVFDVLCPLSGEHEGQFCPVSLEEGEDGGLLVVKCVLKCLVHKKDETPPQPWFPDRQGILLSDGTRLPVADRFFYGTSDVDITKFFSTLGCPLTSVVEIDAFSKIGGNARLYSSGLSAAYIDSTCESIDPWSSLLSGPSLQKAVFRGRTLQEVQAMSGYPWGLQDTSKIVAEPDPETEDVPEPQPPLDGYEPNDAI